MIKWTNAFLDYIAGRTIFRSKVANIILLLMALFYVTMISKAIVENAMGIGQPPLPPLTIESVKVLDTNIRIDKAIFVVLSGHLNIRHCDSYVLGSIVSNNIVILDKVTTIGQNTLDDALENKTPIKLNVGDLYPGSYVYRAEVHNICGGHSSIVLVPLIQFEVKK